MNAFRFSLILAGVIGAAQFAAAQNQPLCQSCADTAKSLKLPGSMTASSTPGVTLSLNNTISTIQFFATFHGLPAGLDITNTTYLGWCADVNSDYNNNNASTVYTPYSTYAANLPANAQNPNWDKVNWVLNHKVANTWTVQQVIWRLLSGSYVGPNGPGG
jgi:hypothetical protein